MRLIVYNVYYKDTGVNANPVRIDAGDYIAGTPGSSATNANATMLSITGDGTTNIIYTVCILILDTMCNLIGY